MALGEFISAFDSVSADLERMWKGYKEGRGGAREAGVRDLVSWLESTWTTVLTRLQSKLVEIGFSGLMQLLLKLVQDGTGKTCDPENMIRHGELICVDGCALEANDQARHHLLITFRLCRPCSR